MKSIILILLVLITVSVNAQTDSTKYYIAKAKEAFNAAQLAGTLGETYPRGSAQRKKYINLSLVYCDKFEFYIKQSRKWEKSKRN